MSGIAVFSFRCLPHWGRGTASAVDRVLSLTAYLRRSFPLSFIPLVPYPARSARHLPHAGKALSVVILLPHMRVFALTMREKRYPRIVAFPIGKGGPRQRRSGALVNGALETISSLFFIPLEPDPARSARHLPHAGKALSVGILFPHMRVFVLTMREKRYSRFAAFPIGEGGPRQRWIGCFR